MENVSIQFINGKIIASPDPIIIKLGDQIRWGVSTQQREAIKFSGTQIKRILILVLVVEIHFANTSPFENNYQRIRAEGISGSIMGTSITGPAIRRGNFKYGVRISEGHSGEFLEDVDPIIIVE